MTKLFNWRWLVLLFAAVAISASLTACGDDDDDDKGNGNGNLDESDLIGEWQCPTGQYYIFNSDGTGYTDNVEFEDYRIRKGWLEIYYHDDWDEKGTITFDNDSFTLDAYDDGEYVRTYYRVDD